VTGGKRKDENAMKTEQPKSLPVMARAPDNAERRAIAAAKQALAEMSPHFDVGTKI
jgi:hypothetical protein